MSDPWESAKAYDRYMGRWSRRIAGQFLGWLQAGPACSWLEVGCGTGPLTQAILETQEPAHITAIDSSSQFIAHAQALFSDPRVQFRVGLAQSLDGEDNSFDVCVSGLVLNFVPQPEQAVNEMRRVVKAGGLVGIYVWDYAQGMQMLRYFWEAAISLDEAARQLDEGPRFPICRQGALEALAHQAGLDRIEARGIEVETVFDDFEDYWQPFLGNVGPAPAYVASLDEWQRERLKERVRQVLPTSKDGSIALKARAWAVKGFVA